MVLDLVPEPLIELLHCAFPLRRIEALAQAALALGVVEVECEG